jgi:sporulation protein YlmC with PRC-barrel domain
MIQIRNTRALVLAALFSCSAGAYAQAQSSTSPAASPGSDSVNWNRAEIRNGISIDRVIGMDVRGSNGNSLGEVQDVIISRDGKVQAIPFDYGGFMNIGDARFRVPWNELKFGGDMDHVIVPLTQQTAERYQDRGQGDEIRVGANEFRASTVIGDAATLRGGERYGEVQDLVVNLSGDVKAVIVDAGMGPGGVRAVPFRASAFDTNRNAYMLPFDRDQLSRIEPFDYRAMNVVERPGDRARGTGATRGGAAGGEGTAGDQRRSPPPRQSRG